MIKEQNEETEPRGGTSTVIASEKMIKSLIYVVHGQQVMMDSDLASLYQVETKVFNQAVKRNIRRFPESFRFQLTDEEYKDLRSQFVTSNSRGGRRYLPYWCIIKRCWEKVFCIKSFRRSTSCKRTY